MFRNTVNTTIGVLLLLPLWPSAQVLAQGRGGTPLQARVTGSCAAGSSVRIINEDGSVVCEVDDTSVGTVTSVGSGSGLTGGPITSTGTISIATGGVTSAHIANGTIGSVNVDSSQIQLRVGSCAAGSSIRIVNADGSVVCQVDGGVTAVTVSAPLASSGGTTPNISLPHVIIENGANDNTAIGAGALISNTNGGANTAIGRIALSSNTSGDSNTASGWGALGSNTTGFNNTANGVNALTFNTTGGQNTANGVDSLAFNTTGFDNTASGHSALVSNTTGNFNTASGFGALGGNTTGSQNTAIGFAANVAANNLVNATAIGSGAVVNASNKIRLGNAAVIVIEGQVPYSFVSDKTKKENFQPVDGKEVLRKIRGFNLTSWNYIGHDPKQFRHYGPVAQEFFAAFGHDGIGTAGSPTTINSGDLTGILMSAVQELAEQNLELRSENAAMKARLDSLEQLIRSDHIGRVSSLVEK